MDVTEMKEEVELLETRKIYIEGEEFIADTNQKIQLSLDSPLLGDSMRSHLISIKLEIETDKEQYRGKFIKRISDKITDLTTLLQAEEI